MRKRRLLIIFSFLNAVSYAQQPSTTHWVTLQLPVLFNQHWQMLNEASYRTLGESFRLNQFFLRTGVKYSFNDKVNVSVSADNIFTKAVPDKSDKEFGKEFRLWEEVVYRLPLKNNFFLLNRLRVEERFIGTTSKTAAYHAMRYRYRLALLKKISMNWNIQLGDEYFLQSREKEIKFNLNRLSLSNYFILSPTGQLEATYYWSKLRSGSQHIFAIAFQKKILAHAKKKNHA